jgi:hypothetical protein
VKARRVRTMSVAAVSLALAGGAAAWAMVPGKAHADAPRAVEKAPVDLWAKGPVDRGNMVQGVLDYRSAQTG